MAPAVEITMAGLGESVSERRIANWLLGDGNLVGTDETRLELATDKAVRETSGPRERRRAPRTSYGPTAELPGNPIGKRSRPA